MEKEHGLSKDSNTTPQISSYHALMGAVVDQMLQSFRGHLTTNIKLDRFKRRRHDKQSVWLEKRGKLRKIMADGVASRLYFFNNSEESTEYVFGFRYVCSTLGMNYVAIRTKLKEELRENNPKALKQIRKIMNMRVYRPHKKSTKQGGTHGKTSNGKG